MFARLNHLVLGADDRVRSALWVFSQYGLSQAIRLATNLVLARLVAPDVFGIMALALTFVAGLAMISDVGIYGVIVKSRRGHDPVFLNTAWTIQVLRGLLLWLICLAVAAGLYIFLPETDQVSFSAIEDPKVPIVFALVSVTLFIDGLRSISMILAYRNFSAGKTVRLELAAQLFSSLVILVLAFYGFDIWAVVVGVLVGAAMTAVGSHACLGGPPARFTLEGDSLKEILKFGKWVFAASMMTFLCSQADRIVFGVFLSSTDFGLYAVATSWIMTVILLFQSLRRKVLQPLFAEKNNQDPKAVSRYYDQIRTFVELICIILFLFFYIFSEWVFGVLYDDRYTGVGLLVSFLCIRILLEPYQLLNTLLLGTGRSRLQFHAVVSQALFIFFGVTAALVFGQTILAMVIFALSSLSGMPVAWMGARRAFGLSLWPELRLFGFAVAATVFILVQKVYV